MRKKNRHRVGSKPSPNLILRKEALPLFINGGRAKERQGFIEGRIQEINAHLSHAEIIDPSKIDSEHIVFGATVVLEDQENGKEISYQIVGVDEADVTNGKVGITSPLARALIGKREGDEVTVNAPKGNVAYDVISIQYQ